MRAGVFCAFLFAAWMPLWAGDAGQPAGVPNFHAVNDHVYRGAQPSAEGFVSLRKLGVKTVIDLRRGSEHGKSEQDIVEQAGMRYVHVPLNGYAAPSNEQMAKLLALLDDRAQWPVFLHCKRGADRTGTVMACYRIGNDHWGNEQALAEAKQDGMSWTEIGMQQYILRFRPFAKQAATAP